MSEATDTLRRLVQTATASGQAIPGTSETSAMRRQREARETQRHVNAVVQEKLAEAELERVTEALIRQGKVAPIQKRDMTGRLITEYIGSPREFLAPFGEPLKKVNMGGDDARRRAAAKQKREQAAYAALAREERSR